MITIILNWYGWCWWFPAAGSMPGSMGGNFQLLVPFFFHFIDFLVGFVIDFCCRVFCLRPVWLINWLTVSSSACLSLSLSLSLSLCLWFQLSVQIAFLSVYGALFHSFLLLLLGMSCLELPSRRWCLKLWRCLFVDECHQMCFHRPIVARISRHGVARWRSFIEKWERDWVSVIVSVGAASERRQSGDKIQKGGSEIGTKRLPFLLPFPLCLDVFLGQQISVIAMTLAIVWIIDGVQRVSGVPRRCQRWWRSVGCRVILISPPFPLFISSKQLNV